MKIVRCDYCGSDLIKSNAISVNVELNKHQHCEKCHQSVEEKTLYFFCSEECFHCYLTKVVNGQASFSFQKKVGEVF